MKLADLTRVGRTPSLPLALELPTGTFFLEKLLRTLPNQRYVGKANWQDKTILIKLFVGTKTSKRFTQELAGVQHLAHAGINTPLLLDQQLTTEGGYLCFEYLDNSQTLYQQWQQVSAQPLLSDEQRAILQQALAAIATLHSKGLWQQDLHLDNLLVYRQQLYWIDGDGIHVEESGHPLSKAKVLANLAIFFAQLPPTLDPFLAELLNYYHSQHSTLTVHANELNSAIDHVRAWRVKDIQKKLHRDCSLFSVKNTAYGYYGVIRQAEDTLAPLLNNPDSYIDTGRFIKGFGTTNVIDTQVNGKHIVLKRYNIKNFKHKLSRFWRPTRGWHSWQEGFRLKTLGIPTAEPLALIEERHCWSRGRAWLVTEFLQGPDLLTHLKPYENASPPEQELKALVQLFGLLIRYRISHGDFKGTNLFWVNNQWVIIDLDAVKQHKSLASFKRAYTKDRARFLRNWPKDSALYTLFDLRLPDVDTLN